MTQRAVTEADFRSPEFRDANPEDYEFRHGDGKLVRKDRWEKAVREIASMEAVATAIHALGREEPGFEIVDLIYVLERIEKDARRYQLLRDVGLEGPGTFQIDDEMEDAIDKALDEGAL